MIGGGVVRRAPRERLTAQRVYWVRADGSDSNNGRANTSAGAFLTIQKAVDTIYSQLDTNGYNVTVRVGAGTFTAGTIIDGPVPGGGIITIQEWVEGATTLSTTGETCISVQNGAVAYLMGFKYTSTGSGACGIEAANARITVWPREFGAIGEAHIQCSGPAAHITLAQSYAITGGGVSHYHGGRIDTSGNITVTLTGSPVFSAYFAGVSFGYQFISGCTFVGAAVGRRYLAQRQGMIDVGEAGETYLPGSLPGTIRHGGQYRGLTYRTPTILDADTHDYLPVSWGGGTETLRISASVPVNLTGLTKLQEGHEVLLYNAGSHPITLVHQSAESSADNRFICADAANIVIPRSGSVRIKWVVLGWVVLGVTGRSTSLTPTILDADADDYAPTGWGGHVSTLRLSASTPVNLTGLLKTAEGHDVLLYNAGLNPITLVHQSADSDSDDRFVCVDATKVVVPRFGSVRLRWVSVGWIVLGAITTRSTSLTPTILDANADDYAPTGWGGHVSTLRVSASTPIDLSGLVKTVEGHDVLLYNAGANAITLLHQNTSSSADNRFICADAASAVVRRTGSVRLRWVSTGWVVQGA